MSKKLRLVSLNTTLNRIQINPSFIKNSTLKNPQILWIQFGISSMEANVVISNKVAFDEIVISSNILAGLKIPTFLTYEYRFMGNKIILGPYIGILLKPGEQLKQNVVYLQSYLYRYEEIGGAILAFSEEGIDKKSLEIFGYVYHPEEKNWIPGTFGYPASIFKKSGLRRSLRNHLHTFMGDTIFNSYIFDKWELYAWLLNAGDIKSILPETRLYTDESDLEYFIKHYPSFYIKPIHGSRGRNVYRLQATKSEKNFSYRLRTLQYSHVYETLDDLKVVLQEKFQKRKYIFQQTVEHLCVSKQSIDFRLMLVKDGKGIWRDVGLIGKIGEREKITNNISTGGMAMDAKQLFCERLNKSEKEADSLCKKLIMWGKRIGECLNETGILCGNLGIDLSVDKEERVWLIEVNNFDPNHTIAIDAGDRSCFYRARHYNLLYAKKLAGFKEEERGD